METSKYKCIRRIRRTPSYHSTVVTIAVSGDSDSCPLFVVMTKKGGVITEERISDDVLFVERRNGTHTLVATVTVVLYGGQVLRVLGDRGLNRVLFTAVGNAID